jgi:hypothetical protein
VYILEYISPQGGILAFVIRGKTKRRMRKNGEIVKEKGRKSWDKGKTDVKWVK